MERSRRSSWHRAASGSAARGGHGDTAVATGSVAPPRAPRRPTELRAHDDVRVDDWYWMRNREDPAVRAHLEAENTYTELSTRHLGPLRERIFDEIRSRVQQSDASVPAPDGPWAYYTRTVEGLQYGILCRRPSEDRALPDPLAAPGSDDEAVLLDQNALAEGHAYFALGGMAVSPDHTTLAYATDHRGTEQFTLRFRDLASERDLGDALEATSYGLAWANDGRTIFYTRPDAANRPHQVWRHRLGEAADELVLEEPDERFFVALERSRTGRFVSIISQSKTTSEVHLLDANRPDAAPTLVAARRTGVEYQVEHHTSPVEGDRLFIVTNDVAPGFRLVVAALDRPDHWEEVLPGSDDLRLVAVDAFARHLVLEGRSGGLTRLHVLRLDDGELHEVAMPDPVFTVGLGANFEVDVDAVRLRYESLVRPPSTYEYGFEDRSLHLVKAQPVLGGFDPDDYTSARLWAEAPDGERVPISIVHRVDTPVDGTAPCLLYGYGAYEISIDPTFSVARLSLLDRGLTFAIAHVRGGGELGRRWYEAGKLDRKPTTFTDYLACADELVATGQADPDRIVARGGSAGGLLMGAAVNLRPDAFRAVVAEVPFVDCLTTMLDRTLPLTVTEFEEWGDPSSDPAVYELIKSYSPYDNVAGAAYPAMLVTAGLNDPRVQYWEPAKWVAKLRSMTTGSAPVLLKTELGAGHAGPSGRYDAWRDEAFALAFVLKCVGIDA